MPAVGHRSIRDSTTRRKTPICPFDDEIDAGLRNGVEACNGSSTYSTTFATTLFRPAPATPFSHPPALPRSGKLAAGRAGGTSVPKRPSFIHSPLT
jgi:hypothetical protein